ncbi:hypothetical protein CMV_008579 [Castanea mollissima]|uniref:non-specific serine/threonine protein kinase n=1 Tax=Castanea mollissima TaxID=60419 RepID=A0A8J4VP59_9ROSI|nr:hypothetical protein CMV_008579 [Castanea mollissima]
MTSKSSSGSAPPPRDSKRKWVLPYQTKNLRDLYTLGRKLGQGQFGITFLCTEKSTGNKYACKSIPKRKLLYAEDYDDVLREIQIMHHLSEHPNVVRIRGTYEDIVAVYLVMELCEGGELFDRIVKKGHYSEREAAKLIKTIVEVVQTCHSLGVMHRDLKPENFLFHSVDEDAALKATDFGLSVFYRPGQTFSAVVGSPFYVAPEVLRKHYGPEIDIWSAGVILYILLSGVPPFWAETEKGIFREILQGKLDFHSDPWPVISESAKELIRKMLDRNPKQRPKAHEVLCHPWIADDNAPDKPIDSAVLSRLKKFSAMNKLKKMALRVRIDSSVRTRPANPRSNQHSPRRHRSELATQTNPIPETASPTQAVNADTENPVIMVTDTEGPTSTLQALSPSNSQILLPDTLQVDVEKTENRIKTPSNPINEEPKINGCNLYCVPISYGESKTMNKTCTQDSSEYATKLNAAPKAT